MLLLKSKYGLTALLALAREAGTGPVLISELADRNAIPKKFLEAILLELKRHGVAFPGKGEVAVCFSAAFCSSTHFLKFSGVRTSTTTGMKP